MRELRFIRKQVAVLMLAAFMVCVGWYGPSGGISSAHAEDEYDPLHTMLALNMAIVSVHRIVNTKDRIILTQEYDNIINNLKIGNIEDDSSMLSLYADLMDVISAKGLREDQAERFQARYKKREQRQFVNALSGIRAYGGSILSMLGSLAISCVSQYFSYQDAKAQIAEELDDELWQLQEQDIRDCNDMQKTLLQSSWSLLRQYSLPDTYRLVQRDLDEYYKALSTPGAGKRKNMLRQIERKFGAYPPYWIYRAMAARESGDEADMRHCYDKFDEVWRPVLRQDPFKVEALKFRISELAAKGTASNTQQMRALLDEMREYTPRDDWQNSLFAGVAYFAMDDKQKAIDCVEGNVDFGYESDISGRILVQMKRGTLDIDSLSPELSALAQGIEKMQSMSAEIGEDIAGALTDYFEGRDYAARAALEPLAEKGDMIALYTLYDMELMKKRPDYSKLSRYDRGMVAHKGSINSERFVKLVPLIETYAKQGSLAAKLIYIRYGAEERDQQLTDEILTSLRTVDASNDSSSAVFYMIGIYELDNKNYKKAIEWYRKAAERGFAIAQSELGLLYYSGNGVTQDHAQAAEWWRKAAEQGYAIAQNDLGLLYYSGNGVTQDYAQAVKWWRKAAEQGHHSAQNRLGYMYFEGIDLTQDYTQAAGWFRKAADVGHADAQNMLGSMYHEGIGVKQDNEQAVTWYRKAAEQGHSLAQYNLGNAYANGMVVTKDYSKAVELWRKSAEQGYAPAQFNLGKAYYNGNGVTQDYKQAAEWCRKAAEQGHTMAECWLGFLYFEGYGVKQDYQQAVYWWTKAADKGYADAQYLLGLAYYDGKGVKKDRREAASWLQKAADQGHEDAKEMLKKL